MDENYEQYSQRGSQFNKFYGSNRPTTRAPFHTRSDFHHRGRGGGYNMPMPMMSPSGYPRPPPPPHSRPSYSPVEPHRGNGRGIRKQSESMIHYTINSGGPQGGTDITGRSAPIIEQNYSVGHHYSTNVIQPLPVASPQPSVQTQAPIRVISPQGQAPHPWNLQMCQYNMYDPQHYLPQIIHMPYVQPQTYNMPWPNNIPLYYDPSKGYYSNGSTNTVPEVSETSVLNAEAPSYVYNNDRGEEVPANGEEKWTDQQNPEDVPGVIVHGQPEWNVPLEDVNVTPHLIYVNSTQPIIVENKENPYYDNINIDIPQEINVIEQEKENFLDNNFNINAPIDKLKEDTFPDKLQVPNIPVSPPIILTQENKVPKKIQRKIKGETCTPVMTEAINKMDDKRNVHKRDGRTAKVKSEYKENVPCCLEQQTPLKAEYEEYESPPPTMLNFEELNKQAEEFRRAELAKLTPIVKDVYIEDRRVAQMDSQEIKAFREFKNKIHVSYVDVEELSVLKPTAHDPSMSPRVPIPNPVTTFEQGFRNYPEIMQQILKQGFSLPTPIQCQMWPCIMKGMDVVGIAQTGSGKTLAFLLPALIHIERQHMPRSQRNSPTVLILAPTRELAQQIDKEVKKYSYKNIRSVCLYGGGSRADQIEAVSMQTEIIIATPGRLNDLVQADKLNLKEVSMLILDEADEMLDQGFEPQINKALLKVRGDRQTILTSATWPASVRRMAYNYTQNPVMVVVGTTDLRAVTSVKQNIVFIEEEEKFNWLIDFCTNMAPMDKAIIFVGKKALADHISSELAIKHINCECIHGALSQCDREQAIADMQSGAVRILVATDVAARGIDIDNVTHIINHDFPRSIEQYVHRIGRTGRAGRLGESHTFISRRDWSSAEELIEILKHAQQEVPQELVDMADRFKNRRDSGGGRGGRGGRGRSSWEDRRGGGDFGHRGGFSDFRGDRRGGGRGNFRY